MTLDLTGVDDVCELTLVEPPGGDPGDGPPRLLVEVPHGATTREHYDRLRARLHGRFPDDLEAFFFVNTDVGAPEVGLQVARSLAASGPLRVLVLRSAIPRTFVDCNRVLEGDDDGPRRLTPGLPSYVTDERDAGLLRALHRRYQLVAERAYAEVCGAGGLALTLHTYAPRSVGITTVDDDIVRALRAAYEPGTWERWPRRPTVDVIDETDDGERVGPVDVVDALLERYQAAGVQAVRNDTYRLHEGSMGQRLATRYPGRVLCVELDRGELADPFVPFQPVTISSAAVERFAGPLVEALRSGLERRRLSRSDRRD